MRDTLKHFSDGVAAIVSRHVDALKASIGSRIDELDAAVKAIRQVPENFQEIIGARVAAAVAALPVPKDGVDGKDGKDADESAIVEKVLANIMPPKDGRDGLPGERGADGKDGKDGKDADPVDEKSIIAAVVSQITVPKDGEPGRDGLQIEILHGIDETRKYARNTYATHRGGLFRSIRTTDPLEGKDFQVCGWEVVLDGLADIDIDDSVERCLSIRLVKSSGVTIEKTLHVPMVIDRGVYREDSEYKKGDGTTWGGSFWIAQKDTKDKPDAGTGAWRLAIKRGRDGKDGKDFSPPAPIKVGS
jgi:hypothetical protein